MKNEYCTLKNSKLIWKIDNICNNKAYLSMNNKKMTTNIANICIINDYIPDTKNTTINIQLNEHNISNEIMLRHKTKLDALEELDKFIDNAICNTIPRIKIIHGKHGGIIRNAVHDYLDNSPFISSYNFGDYHEGGFGVTVAYIKINTTK